MATGLAMLLVAGWWPDAPAITAMSLIALGATLTTVDRFRGMAAHWGVVAVHLFVYANLYVLFVGAECHSALTGPQDGLALWQVLDLAASVGIMALVVRRSLAAMFAGENVSAR